MSGIRLCDLGFDPHDVYTMVRRYYGHKGHPYDKLTFVECLARDEFLTRPVPAPALTDQLELTEEGAAFVRLLMI